MSDINPNSQSTTETANTSPVLTPKPTIVEPTIIESSTKVEANPEVVVESNSDDNTPKMEQVMVLDFLASEETQKMLKGLGFWLAFQAILSYVGAGFLVLSGIVYAISIIGLPVAVIYFAIAAYSVWIGIMLFKASTQVNAIKLQNNQNDFNTQTVDMLSNLKTIYKIYGIMTIISIVFGIILFVLAIGFFVFMLSNGGSNPYMMNKWMM